MKHNSNNSVKFSFGRQAYLFESVQFIAADLSIHSSCVLGHDFVMYFGSMATFKHNLKWKKKVYISKTKVIVIRSLFSILFSYESREVYIFTPSPEYWQQCRRKHEQNTITQNGKAALAIIFIRRIMHF